MDRPKTTVVKSKSSNSAITSKSEPRKNKKSRSNAEIQPLLLKKRGVYVEKKAMKLSNYPQGGNLPKKQIKPPPIPRPNRKRFLNSVLTILSKSTAGTQYPDTDDSPTNRRCEKIKFRNTTLDETANEQGTTKKRSKYRSRILNDHKNDLKNLVVLKSRKDIVHTPSNNSSIVKEPDVIKWSEVLPPLVNTKEELERSIFENANQGIVKEVLEGIKLKERKVKLVDNDQQIEAKKDEKGIYNFFVDLLETTFSIYNVKPEYNTAPSITSSKFALEIDESVAKRLNIDHHFDDVVRTPSKHFCCLPENNWADDDLMNYTNLQNKSCTQKKCSPKSSRKLKTRSFEYGKQKPIVYAHSSIPYKRSHKKNTKNELLDTIKEQLKRDYDTFEEPQNLYQALKQMARNKRKHRQSICFDKTPKTTTGFNDPECVFKRKKVFNFNTKSSTKRSSHRPESDVFRSMVNNISDRSSNIKKAFKANVSEEESEHSLEVYGFDYELLPDKKITGNQLKEVVLTYHSSPTQSDQDFNINEALLKYSASGTSSVQNYINWNHGITSVTRIIKQN